MNNGNKNSNSNVINQKNNQDTNNNIVSSQIILHSKID